MSKRNEKLARKLLTKLYGYTSEALALEDVSADLAIIVPMLDAREREMRLTKAQFDDSMSGYDSGYTSREKVLERLNAVLDEEERSKWVDD